MLYIIKKSHDQEEWMDSIRNYLSRVFPVVRYAIVSDIALPPTPPRNSYILLIDKICEKEEVLNQLRQLRQHEPYAPMILISNHIDYHKLFRSHLSFLEVIDSNNDMLQRIYSAIDFILQSS